jgi:hypothetical protein
MDDNAADTLSVSGKFLAEAAAVDFAYFFLPDLGRRFRFRWKALFTRVSAPMPRAPARLRPAKGSRSARLRMDARNFH